MWLPRLRFTLVPHSSRNQFWKIFFFFFSFSSLVWGLVFFSKFFSTKVQLHLCPEQRGGGSRGWLGWRDPNPSGATLPWQGPSPGPAWHPWLPWHHQGFPQTPGTFPRSHKCLGPSPSNPALCDRLDESEAWSVLWGFDFFFFLTLHKCSFWVQFVAWTLR